MSTAATSSSATTTVSSVDARIDAFPKVPLGIAGFVALLICYFFANYDISVTALVVPSLLQEFRLTPNDLAAPVFWNLAGYGIGAYFFGYVADRWGRQRGLFATIVVLALGGFLSAASWDVLTFTTFRFIAGAGMGAVLAVCSTYISEFAPAKKRGQYLAILYTAQAVLLTIVAFVSLPVLSAWPVSHAVAGDPTSDVIPGLGWRLLLGFGGLVVVALFFLNRRGMMESPRWLARAGRLSAAERNLQILEARVYKGREMPVIVDEQPIEPLTNSVPVGEQVRPWKVLVRSPYAGRLVVILLFWLLYYVAAYGFLSYQTLLLEALGVPAADSLTITVVSRISNVVIPLLMIFIVERVERRTLMISGLVLMILGMLSFLLPLGGASAYIGSIAMTLGIGLSVSPGYIYTAEIFPTKARATASSIADGVGHMGGAISPYAVLPLLTIGSGIGAAWVIIATAILAIFVVMFGPKTKGKDLATLNKE